MTPNVQMSANTGGVGGALGGMLLGRVGLGGVAGGLKFKEASTSILISDVRSSIQVAAAEGKATKTDFNLGGLGFGGGVAAVAGGYTSTPEGKIIAASFLDNYNKIVLAIRDNPSLLKQSSGDRRRQRGRLDEAAMPVSSGQVMLAKIGNVKIYSGPSRDSKVVGTVSKTDELVASGEVKNGFVQVDTSNASGWVQQSLVSATAAERRRRQTAASRRGRPFFMAGGDGCSSARAPDRRKSRVSRPRPTLPAHAHPRPSSPPAPRSAPRPRTRRACCANGSTRSRRTRAGGGSRISCRSRFATPCRRSRPSSPVSRCCARSIRARNGSARLLVGLPDGQAVESVLLPRDGLCVSTQVGCAVGCVFCMTGREGCCARSAAPRSSRRSRSRARSGR